MHCIWYTAMSMDGRIATRDDSLAFLETIDHEGEPDEFSEFLAGIDAILIGGSTMRWLHAQGHSMPASGNPVWLLSHDPALLAAVGDDVSDPVVRRQGDVATVLEEIAEAGHERVWICGGGDVAGQLLAVDAVDEVIVTVAPTALGAGPSLFDAPDLPRRRFRLEECRPFGRTAARLRWVRDRSEAGSTTADD